jgi:hypothetical protein
MVRAPKIVGVRLVIQGRLKYSVMTLDELEQILEMRVFAPDYSYGHLIIHFIYPILVFLYSKFTILIEQKKWLTTFLNPGLDRTITIQNMAKY